jgi:hypothetical protein
MLAGFGSMFLRNIKNSSKLSRRFSTFHLSDHSHVHNGVAITCLPSFSSCSRHPQHRDATQQLRKPSTDTASTHEAVHDPTRTPPSTTKPCVSHPCTSRRLLRNVPIALTTTEAVVDRGEVSLGRLRRPFFSTFLRSIDAPLAFGNCTTLGYGHWSLV